jgi:hypothetical protein
LPAIVAMLPASVACMPAAVSIFSMSRLEMPLRIAFITSTLSRGPIRLSSLVRSLIDFSYEGNCNDKRVGTAVPGHDTMSFSL